MSLLLDALHRASKDKEKAAAGSQPVVQTPAPVAPESLPLELNLAAVAPPVAVDFPSLVSEPEAPTLAAVKPEMSLDFEPTLQFTIEPDPSTPATPQEPVAPVVPVVSTVPFVPERVSKPEIAPPLEFALAMEPVAPPPVARVEPVMAAPSKGPEEVAQTPANPSRIAKDIRRAYAKDALGSEKSRRRTWALGGVALLLALGGGSVALGLWGDPLTWLGLGGNSSVIPMASQSPPLASLPEMPPSVEPADPVPEPVAPTVAAAPESVQLPAPTPQPLGVNSANSAAKPPARAPQAAEAPAAPRTPSGTETVVPNRTLAGPTKFEAQTRGASALEQAYAALLEERWDAATRLYEQVLRSSAEERDALLGLAYIAQRQGQREEAQSYYRRVLRQDPNNAVANAALLTLEYNADSGLTASRARELVARQPDSAATLAMAGNAMVRDGLLADAAQMFARAQKLEPTNPLHSYNHAVALDRLGQYGQALKQYENTLRLAENLSPSDPRNFTVNAARQRLSQLRQALGTATSFDP